MHQRVIAKTPKFLMFDLQEFTESQHLIFCADYVLIRPQCDGFVLYLAQNKMALSANQLVLLAPFNPFRITRESFAKLEPSSRCDILHFRLNALGQTFVDSVPFSSVRSMLDKAKSGLLFHADKTMQVNHYLKSIENTFEFKQVLNLLALLDGLSSMPADGVLMSQNIEITNSKRMENRVVQALKYIEENLAEPLTVALLSKQLCMAESTFSRFFHANIGVSFRQYLIEQRIRQAGRYLVSSDWSIAHISGEVGFSSLSNFNAKFKALFLITPKQYRLNHFNMRDDIAHSSAITGQVNKHVSLLLKAQLS